MSGAWNDEGDFVAVKVTNSWDDEPDVPDSWDVEEPEKPAPKPVKVKLTLEEKIKQREEKKRQEIEEKLKEAKEAQGSQKMTELQRQRLAEEAEADLLEDLMGDSKLKASPSTDGIDALIPTTKEEFTRLNELLKDKFTKLETSPYYSIFGEAVVRDVSQGMDLDSLKSVATAINALCMEKQKLNKNKSKKKAKGKGLKVERNDDYDYNDNYDYNDDNDAGDDYDDFI